jgi:putative ABC transport system permease protein
MRRVCLIGQTVKEEIFGDVDPVGKTVRLGKSGFTVVGELARRGSGPSGGNMDNRLVIPLTTMMRRVANVQHVSHIRVVLKDSPKMQEIAEKLRKLLRRRHNIQPPEQDDFGIVTPKTISKMTVEISSTLKTLLFVTAVICLLGGGVVVMAIMLMSVSERTNEIGIRRAVGATRRDILIQFLSEAVVSTTAGGVVGFAIGMGAMGAMLKLSKMQPVFTPWAILWGVVTSMLIGVVFGLLPAYRAARLQPVDALRD